MVKFKNVTKIYSNHSGVSPIMALEDISFEVKEKEFVSIVGRSGAGKTTLLKLLLAEEKPTQGQIFFDDKNVNNLESGELPQLRRKIGAVFQDYKLLSSKTTYENISYVMEVIGASNEEIFRDVPKILEIVGLENRANNFPAELSGGEKQRVAIARAIAHRPEVILADEPTGNLDPYNTLDIIRLLLKIQEIGTTVILATHNKEIINRLGKRVITLEKGKIIRDEERGRFIL
ncbi:MAG: cell division ATP-binding protein FtsE [Parcubacteria group bacterium CG2_30_36_18]|uniref:Cell division ATP-binding protein FtsE n=4 Tax=Candidatus Nealsoniibacteriota TaxID=1817911 RepID=A0A2M8DM11_9BACT|nr:MAG: cell division ATP-binding protein FtsE [Parcubacteria group bacterium CG2_30_36_18]PIP24650.1 MAG: cell division ATP-binding protein FtsE [Candidatus Nealsonbacteria bacterium CG23_combo_of_CG06-09_8_20_14_all_36_125]PIR71973.1 MAG: cell division ATP-binding protein FtsE [Candidatus Nealsonbacteria bacterium CG10_big_fil_rev_8_21_14_0_10_36_228]PIX88728.1 MAG: cell division ATP-binding protein FtsE [Candidatus Nealsonbacteria bacterium CG_4_10_14_3_um_filter_36_16]PJB98957.1 MAG: cell d